MAVIFRGKAVFLEHPRTGSTAVREALKRIGGQPAERHSFVKARQRESTIVTIRNPFDILVSWWLIIGERKGYKTFGDFISGCRDQELMTRGGLLFYYTRHANIVMRYETLASDLATVLRGLNLPQIQLKKRNKTKGKLPYHHYYTPDLILLVYRIYGEELKKYGYTFT